MNIRRSLHAALAAALLIPFSFAWAQGNDFARLASSYAAWAGGKANAEALVSGLRDGRPVTLVTSSPERGTSLAGFTPAGPMTYGSIEGLLSNAQRSLARAGLSRPNAEEIQAALIGGEITTAQGTALAMPRLIAVG